jgi:hypothetical protein
MREVTEMAGKICIHGHFYQPPRENPWTGVVAREDSAAPWHDWNERITDECYLPNTAARILDGKGLIRTVSNTYSRISFDLGPTLLTWLERERPGVYDAVLGADTLARERFSGHGSALAHPYHHVILPLLSPADRETEVRWGIRDFEDRFGRYPEGMWLPEMAVDLGTLDILADHGIRFTILSPHQGFLDGGDEQGADTPGRGVDTTVPGRCVLPSGNEIAVFFPDAALGTELAFGDLLGNGDRFCDRLLSRTPDHGLLHLATDGETFGHHHRFGEMALGWCLDRLESSHPTTLTIPGEYLADHPPEQEVGIVERTSWSCPHGIGRWDDGCPCESGRHAGWSHAWRGPFRSAIQALSSALSGVYAREAAAFFPDPWSARDDSIRMLGDPSPASVGRFFRDHASRSLEPGEQEKALALLEMARQGLAMHTSCAWFFDDIADREAVQVLRHAARALQLARDWAGATYEPALIAVLSDIPGNRPLYPDGGVVYRECVLPLVVPRDVQAACLALIACARDGAAVIHADAYTGEYLACGHLLPAHDLSLAGRPVTYCLMGAGTESAALGISGGDGLSPDRISGYLLPALWKKGYADAAARLSLVFPSVFTPDSLPPAGKSLALRVPLLQVTRVFHAAAGVLFDRYTAAGEGGRDRSSPDLSLLAWYVLMHRLEQVLSSPVSTADNLQRIAGTLSLQGRGALPIPHSSGRFMDRLMGDWVSHPEDRGRLSAVRESLILLRAMGAAPPLWDLQNRFIALRDGSVPFLMAAAAGGDPAAAGWWEEFRALGALLGVAME